MPPTHEQAAYRFCSSVGSDAAPHYLADRVAAPPELHRTVRPCRARPAPAPRAAAKRARWGVGV